MKTGFEYKGNNIEVDYYYQPFERQTHDYEGSPEYTIIETLFINGSNCSEALCIDRIRDLMDDLLEKTFEQ